MSSGRRSRAAIATSVDPVPGGASTSASRRVADRAPSLPASIGPWTALALCLALGGCVSGTLSPEREAERRATLERWSRCLERQGDVATLSDMHARFELGCAGHRRDVLRAFPPNMEPRLQRLMDERRNTLLRTRLRESETIRDAGDDMLQGVMDALSTS